MQHQFVEGDQHGLGSHPQPQPHANTHPHPLALAQSHDMHGAIHREIEKERIRQEIIMSEILRRRALEAEVRRELMVERELALHGGSNGFHFGSASPMELDLPMRLPFVEAEGRFLEERMMLSLTQVNNLSNRRESRLSESLQFQSASDNVRSLVKPVLEGVREKKKINLQVSISFPLCMSLCGVSLCLLAVFCVYVMDLKNSLIKILRSNISIRGEKIDILYSRYGMQYVKSLSEI